MIKALNIASQGMLQAEKRATDIAREILKSSSEATSFSGELNSATESTTLDPVSGHTSATPDHTFGNKPATVSATPATAQASGYSDLLQQMVDLKSEEHAFKASAKAFKRVDETLGSLLDDKG